MMDQKAVSRHITKRVALDKNTLTYRLLSRELGLTVAEAKSFLAVYADDPSTAERGVQITWALSGWLKASVKADADDGMDIDSEGPSQSQSQDSVKKRAVILVAGDKLERTLGRFEGTPSRHVYAITPSAPTASTLCSASCLAKQPSTSAASENKWKEAPAGGYGGIVHPDGERRKTVKKNAVASTSTTKPTAAAAAAAKKDVKPSGTGSLFAKPTKSAAPPRPIGALGGLFASRSEPPPKKEKEKAKVPAKRKASPPPAEKKAPPKKVSNGIFGDEEVESDDDGWNAEEEEAMRMADEEEAAKKKTKAADAAKQSKQVEAMMLSDDVDAMVVDPPAKAAPKAATKAKPKQATLSFSKK